MDTGYLTRRLVDQRAELVAPRRHPLILREAFEHSRHVMTSSLIKVVIGPRRAGKSVFCTQLLEGIPFSYANFDDEALGTMKADELNDLIEVWHRIDGNVKTVFLDEIQNVDGWELFVNRLQRNGIDVVLSGSNSRLLSTELASHLTGRHRTIEVHPFSFREFLRYHAIALPPDPPSTAQIGLIKGALARYLEAGGFSESYEEPEPRRYLADLYHSIIARDIAFRRKIRQIELLKQIARYLFAHLGARITHHRLRKMFDVGSLHTVQNYVAYLAESYLIFVLDRYTLKPKERHTAARKIIPVDTGMARALNRGTDNPQGYLYETAVALELLRRRTWNESVEIEYWQNQQGHEIDFVVSEQSRASTLIQVCYDPSNPETKNRECRSLIAGHRELSCDNLLVITDSYETQERHNGSIIRYVPLWKWLLD